MHRPRRQSIAFAVFATQAAAVDINLTDRPAGQSIGGVATAGSQPNNAQGGGDLQTIVNLAAQYWESTFADTHTVNIEYGWAPLISGTAGSHNLLTEGGSPHRETSGTIRFDSDLTTFWFIDASPLTSSEFTTLTTYTQNLGGGTMTTGIEYTGGTGPAGNFDLKEVSQGAVISPSADASWSNTRRACRSPFLARIATSRTSSRGSP